MGSTIMARTPADAEEAAEGVGAADEVLASRARAGDQEAFSELMTRYRGIVYAYAFARLLNRDEAEDMTQEVFVRAYLALPELRTHTCWAAWLMRILRNLCHDSYRRRRVHPVEPLPENRINERSSPEWQALAEEQKRQMRAAVAALPEKLLTPLLMHYVSGRTYAEIALALGVPHSTIVGRLAAALRRLRRRLRLEEL